MTTLQITLDDDVAARLKSEADAEQVSVETLITALAAARADRASGISPEFETIARELVETYKPLLDRLA
jgi:hypothetical protein